MGLLKKEKDGTLYKYTNTEKLKTALMATSPVDVQGVPSSDVDKEILRQSIIAEHDAINLYEQMAAKSKNPKLRGVLLDVAKEEKTHTGEFQALLEKLDTEHAKELEEGAEEVQDKISMVVSMLDELENLNAVSSFQLKTAELHLKKKEPISRERAERSLKRLTRLESTKPLAGEMARAGGVGAVVGPIAQMAYRIAAGPGSRAMGASGKPLGIYRGPRDLAASAAYAAVMSSMLPAGRHKLEREVEKQHLREYLGHSPRGTLRSKIKRTTGL
jgi:rubrerythrin